MSHGVFFDNKKPQEIITNEASRRADTLDRSVRLNKVDTEIDIEIDRIEYGQYSLYLNGYFNCSLMFTLVSQKELVLLNNL